MNESFNYRYSAEQQKEIADIRKKYMPLAVQEDKMTELRRLDAGADRTARIAAMSLGIFSLLVFGTGMSCFLVWNLLVPGGLLCVLGAVGMLAAPGLYRKLFERRKAEIAPEILRLAEELSR